MKRVLLTAAGRPRDVLQLADVESPRPGRGEVLVQVRARPINPADLLLIEGRHLFTPDYPAPVGIEGAGVIAAVGEGVPAELGLSIGREVSLPFGGTWSEQICLPADDVIPLPPGTDLLQAAMLCVNPVTALGLIAGLEAGDWLVHDAGTSAVARIVTRLARARGVRSISVVRRPEVAGELRALGADEVLADGPGLAARVRELTGGGAHRALDAVSGDAAGRMLSAVREGGELVCYGLLASDQVTLPAAEVVFRDVRVRGYSRLRALRSLSPGERRRALDEALALLRAGAIDTTVERTYPLEEVHAAADRAMAGERRGKILLVS